MDRRNFLQLAALALAGKAAVRAFPFRVGSIPKEIVVAPAIPKEMFEHVEKMKASMEMLTGMPPSLYGIPYFQSVPPFEWIGISRSPI